MLYFLKTTPSETVSTFYTNATFP